MHRSEEPIVATPREDVLLGDAAGVTFDIRHGHDPDDDDLCGETFPGHVLFEERDIGAPGPWGPQACGWTRVWVLDAAGVTVVILGGDGRGLAERRSAAFTGEIPNNLDALAPLWDALLIGLTFCNLGTCEDLD